MTTLAARRLARRLISLREAAGFTGLAVEKSKITSRRSLSRIESAATVPAWPIATELATLYGADATTKALVRELALRAAEPGWTERYADAVPPAHTLLPELEGAATSVDAYEPEIIPGFLQTREYAEAILCASPLVAPELRPAAIHLRQRRRALLLPSSGGPKLRVLLTEGGLAREVGGPDVHRAQLDSLRRDAARIDIRYLPASAGAYAALVGPFEALRFDDEPDVVYVEHLARAEYLEASRITGSYDDVFQASWNRAKEFPGE